MKNSLRIFLSAIVLLLAVSVSAQFGTTYTDDFETGHDYLTSGVEGTIWDGILLNDTTFWGIGVAAEITSLNTNDFPGSLLFASTNSHWAVYEGNGAFLYKNITDAGADFEIQVKIVGGDFPTFDSAQVYYHMPGLMAKVAGDSTFVLVQCFDIPAWSAVYGVRDIIPAGDLAQENWQWQTPGGDTIKIVDYPYVKLDKLGNTLTGYYSADGMAWETIYSVEKAEFEGAEIQVGLYSATYTADEGQVLFDDLQIVDFSEGTGISELAPELPVKTFYNGREIVVESRSSSLINGVKLYGIDGSLRKVILTPASIVSIPVSQQGLYILVSEVDGQYHASKIAVQ